MKASCILFGLKPFRRIITETEIHGELLLVLFNATVMKMNLMYAKNG